MSKNLILATLVGALLLTAAAVRADFINILTPYGEAKAPSASDPGAAGNVTWQGVVVTWQGETATWQGE